MPEGPEGRLLLRLGQGRPQDSIRHELIVIAGPTASGKSELAVALARALRGEVVSADSRQVYKSLDAATAKPRRDASGRVDGVPYHLVDCARPEEIFDAARYAREAGAVLDELARRGVPAVVAGGTGLYIKALTQGLSPLPPKDDAVRRRLEQQAATDGRAALHRRLAAVDPAAAAKIPPNNIQRLVRALEVHESTGKPISSFWGRRQAPAARRASLAFVIEWPAETLRRRIAERAALMWPALLDEIQTLRRRYTGAEPAFQSLGYREALAFADGALSSAQGLEALIAATAAYAKRQRTWFRTQLPGAVSVPGGATDAMLKLVLARVERAAR